MPTVKEVRQAAMSHLVKLFESGNYPGGSDPFIRDLDGAFYVFDGPDHAYFVRMTPEGAEALHWWGYGWETPEGQDRIPEGDGWALRTARWANGEFSSDAPAHRLNPKSVILRIDRGFAEHAWGVASRYRKKTKRK